MNHGEVGAESGAGMPVPQLRRSPAGRRAPTRVVDPIGGTPTSPSRSGAGGP